MTTPPWIAAQVRQLLAQRGHAWLLHGPSGLGQYELALALAASWLCEQAAVAQGVEASAACGVCGSCHAIKVRAHADLCVLMPELTMLEFGWPLGDKAQAELDEKKRKPSKEIRVDAMRDAVEFSQRTSARGRGKVILVFPAESMNAIAANTLLKTLEEPAGELKFVLASESAHQLLPTIRSRCMAHTMCWPDAVQSQQWLESSGVSPAQAALLLKAAGGRPAEALHFVASGRDPAAWSALPAALCRGDVLFFKDWGAAQLIDALQKLCHDLLACRVGALPRFFCEDDLALEAPSVRVLLEWSKALVQSMRTMDHPFHPGLMHEALVGQAQTVLNSTHIRKIKS